MDDIDSPVSISFDDDQSADRFVEALIRAHTKRVNASYHSGMRDGVKMMAHKPLDTEYVERLNDVCDALTDIVLSAERSPQRYGFYGGIHYYAFSSNQIKRLKTMINACKPKRSV